MWPGARTGLWPRAIAAVVITVAVGLAVWLLRVSPILENKPSVAARLATEFAFDHLVAVFVTVLIAAIVGGYAVAQVELGRQAIVEDREARRAERLAETSRILMALLGELHHNWITALYREGRVRVPTDIAQRATFGFKRATFDQLKAGPLWGVAEALQVWPNVSDAYARAEMLDLRLRPEPPWLARLIGAGVMVALKTGPIRDRLILVAGPLAGMIALDVVRQTLSIQAAYQAA